MANHNVFVYGTLKSKNAVRGLNSCFYGAKYISEATTEDSVYNMVNMGPFPAAVLNGENKIKGEFYQVDSETLEVLDQIEGYPHFYNRTRVKTNIGDAWMYYIPDVSSYNAEPINPQEGVLEWTD